jgi:hypothetical protein
MFNTNMIQNEGAVYTQSIRVRLQRPLELYYVVWFDSLIRGFGMIHLTTEQLMREQYEEERYRANVRAAME